MTDRSEGWEQVAGGGLLHRRALLLGGGLAVAGLACGVRVALGAWSPAAMLRPGAPLSGGGTPGKPARRIVPDLPFPGTGSSRAPLEQLHGVRTPNGLHFQRHHNGIPEIDPAQHELLVHGLVRQPLLFRYEDLLRYPRYTRTLFLECSGNSGTLAAPAPHRRAPGS